jgi:hypothetical protein
MPTADRQARYVRQNGRLELTQRQRRRLRKTESRLKHGRDRVERHGIKHTDGPELGRKQFTAKWVANAYRRWLKNARKTDRRAKLGRYTPPRA